MTGSQPTTQWLGRACAVVAVACFALALVAVHRGRVVQASSQRIVADLGRGNDPFAGVDLSSAQGAQAALDSLSQVLGQLGDATHANVDLLTRTESQVRALAASGAGDLGIAQALQATTAAVAGDVAKLRDAAVGGEAGAARVASLLTTTADLVRAINTELARLGQKLAILPELG